MFRAFPHPGPFPEGGDRILNLIRNGLTASRFRHRLSESEYDTIDYKTTEVQNCIKRLVQKSKNARGHSSLQRSAALRLCKLYRDGLGSSLCSISKPRESSQVRHMTALPSACRRVDCSGWAWRLEIKLKSNTLKHPPGSTGPARFNVQTKAAAKTLAANWKRRHGTGSPASLPPWLCIPWDKVDDWSALRNRRSVGHPHGAINPNVFQEQEYKRAASPTGCRHPAPGGHLLECVESCVTARRC